MTVTIHRDRGPGQIQQAISAKDRRLRAERKATAEVRATAPPPRNDLLPDIPKVLKPVEALKIAKRMVRKATSGDHREFAMAAGEMSEREFEAFNAAWMAPCIAHLRDGGLFGTFIDWRSVELVIRVGRSLDLALLNVVVWAKTNGGMGSLWRSQHELLPMFKKGDEPPVARRAGRSSSP